MVEVLCDGCCVSDRYECMKECWSVDPDDRPDFTELAEIFSNMLHASVKEVRNHPNSWGKYGADIVQKMSVFRDKVRLCDAI